MATTTTTAPEPTPFECPNCGGNSFRADYYQSVSQGCTLVKEADGTIRAEDWNGDEDTYDDGCTQDDRYLCADCGWTLTVGDWTFTEREPDAYKVECARCGGSEDDVQGCIACCRDCGHPCSFEKDGEGFHEED